MRLTLSLRRWLTGLGLAQQADLVVRGDDLARVGDEGPVVDRLGLELVATGKGHILGDVDVVLPEDDEVCDEAEEALPHAGVQVGVADDGPRGQAVALHVPRGALHDAGLGRLVGQGDGGGLLRDEVDEDDEKAWGSGRGGKSVLFHDMPEMPPRVAKTTLAGPASYPTAAGGSRERC